MRDNLWGFKTIDLLKEELKKTIKYEKVQEIEAEGMRALQEGRLKDAKALLGKSTNANLPDLFAKKREEIKAAIRGHVSQKDVQTAEKLLKFASEQDIFVGETDIKTYGETVVMLKIGEEMRTKFDSDMTKLIQLWEAKDFLSAFTLETEIDTLSRDVERLGKDSKEAKIMLIALGGFAFLMFFMFVISLLVAGNRSTPK
eukprot:jgi/Mesvir1/4873/Mv11143-RA.1